MIQAFGEKLEERVQKEWTASQRYDKMKKTDPEIPSRQIPQAHYAVTEKTSKHIIAAKDRTYTIS
jgi:hypothetical protein